MNRHTQIAQRQRLMRQQARRRQLKQAQARRVSFDERGRITNTEEDPVHSEGEGLRSSLSEPGAR
jgi:hypothetical protein